VQKEMLVQKIKHTPAGKEAAASAFLARCTVFLKGSAWRFGGSILCLFEFPSIKKHQTS
jgi:hypothetical protein